LAARYGKDFGDGDAGGRSGDAKFIGVDIAAESTQVIEVLVGVDAKRFEFGNQIF